MLRFAHSETAVDGVRLRDYDFINAERLALEIPEDVKYKDPFLLETIIVDYFKYRVQLEGLEWEDAPEVPYENLPFVVSVRTAALLFENEYFNRLEGFVDLLWESDEYLTLHKYTEALSSFVSPKVGGELGLTYGRLVAAIAFGGLVASHMARHGRFDPLNSIVSFTYTTLEARMRQTWPTAERTWVNFFPRQ